MFVSVPYDVQDDQLDFYSRQFGKYQDYGKRQLPSTVPDSIGNVLKTYDRVGQKSIDVRVSIVAKERENMGFMHNKFSERLFFHTPELNIGLESSSGDVCFQNRSREWVKVIYSIIPREGEFDDDDDGDMDEEKEEMTKKVVQKDEHITPFQEELKKIAKKSKKVRAELNTADNMEKRMRRTADSTNSRVIVLGYVSIGFLILTSFAQTRYLKSFFKKKKVI